MTTPVDFGRDTSCTTSLRTGRLSSGPRLVAEAALRRLTTPRGKLRGGEAEANYGIDLAEYVGTTSPKSDAAALPGRISAELAKDERIQGTNVTVTTTMVGASATFTIAIEAITAAGPFTLRIGINALTVELLGIKADS